MIHCCGVLCRDGRAKPPRDRSISPAPFAYQNTSKMTPSAKSSTTQNRSKSHNKPLVNSRTKKAAETGGSGNTAASGSTTSSKPSQAGSNVNIPKMKKSQKKQPKVANPGPSVQQPDAQPSPYPPPHGVQSKTNNMLGPLAKESNPFNQTSNHPSDPTQQKSTLEDSSGSSSGSSSSSSSGSSDSESDPESPLRHAPSASLPSSGGGGVNVSSGMNMPSFPPSQPPVPARGTCTYIQSGGCIL